MVDITDYKELERTKFVLEHGRTTIRTSPEVDFNTKVAEGDIPAHSLTHKFGATTLTTSIAPITMSGFYRTPTTPTALEVVSDDADDTNGGAGAQTVIVIGLTAGWVESSETVTLNGTTAVALANSYLRVTRWYVNTSGSYANQSVGSHQGNLTIQESGGGDVWSKILNTPFPVGQSQIGATTVPTGKTAYLISKTAFVDSLKTANLFFFQRPLADDVSAPYSGIMRMTEQELNVSGGFQLVSRYPKGPFVGPCDLGFMGNVPTTTGECSVEFELLIQDTT